MSKMFQQDASSREINRLILDSWQNMFVTV